MRISGEVTVDDVIPGAEQLMRRMAGRWVELPVGGGSQVGRLEAWGVDEHARPWVRLSGTDFNLGALRGPWGGLLGRRER